MSLCLYLDLYKSMHVLSILSPCLFGSVFSSTYRFVYSFMPFPLLILMPLMLLPLLIVIRRIHVLLLSMHSHTCVSVYNVCIYIELSTHVCMHDMYIYIYTYIIHTCTVIYISICMYTMQVSVHWPIPSMKQAVEHHFPQGVSLQEGADVPLDLRHKAGPFRVPGTSC